MGMMNAVAVLGVIIMIVMYIPINRFLRDRKMFMEQSGAEMRSRNRKNKTKARVSVASPVTSQDRAIGLTIFVAAMIAAFIVRVVMGGIYHGHEYDMNCFIAWADMAYKDGLSNFYISEAFTDYPPGYIYILYVIGWLRDVFHIAWNSVTSDILTKMPAMLADLGTGYLLSLIHRISDLSCCIQKVQRAWSGIFKHAVFILPISDFGQRGVGTDRFCFYFFCGIDVLSGQ